MSNVSIHLLKFVVTMASILKSHSRVWSWLSIMTVDMAADNIFGFALETIDAQ